MPPEIARALALASALACGFLTALWTRGVAARWMARAKTGSASSRTGQGSAIVRWARDEHVRQRAGSASSFWSSGVLAAHTGWMADAVRLAGLSGRVLCAPFGRRWALGAPPRGFSSALRFRTNLLRFCAWPVLRLASRRRRERSRRKRRFERESSSAACPRCSRLSRLVCEVACRSNGRSSSTIATSTGCCHKRRKRRTVVGPWGLPRENRHCATWRQRTTRNCSRGLWRASFARCALGRRWRMAWTRSRPRRAR